MLTFFCREDREGTQGATPNKAVMGIGIIVLTKTFGIITKTFDQ